MITAIQKIKSPFNSVYYVFISAFLFSVHDVIIKWISGKYPVHEVVFIRSCIAIIPILMIAHWNGGLNSLKTKCYSGHIIRSLLMFGSYISYYLSLSALPMAVTISLFFSCPIFITILSVLFLKEKVEAASWIAVVAGFIGVVVMLKPGSEIADPAAFLAILSALLYAMGSVMTIDLGKTESGLSLVFYLMVVYIVCSTILAFGLSNFNLGISSHPSQAFFFRAWQLPENGDLLLFLSIGLISAVSIYCMIQAYRLELPSKVAPFEYISVLLAVCWGYFFWKDVLDPQSIIGIILIIGSGLYILYGKRASKIIKVSV